jgi:hypothetical protein
VDLPLTNLVIPIKYRSQLGLSIKRPISFIPFSDVLDNLTSYQKIMMSKLISFAESGFQSEFYNELKSGKSKIPLKPPRFKAQKGNISPRIIANVKTVESIQQTHSFGITERNITG